MKRIIIIALFLCVFALAAGFSALNPTLVSISFYVIDFTIPLSIIVVVAILIGAILTSLIISVSLLKLRYENRRLRKKLTVSEQEINSLRILPIKDVA
jgi:putative membrane protein